jgi:hypothetical protein
MNNTRTLDDSLDTLGWGALFAWWGITILFSWWPEGIAALGVAAILFGLNAVRRQKGTPLNGFSMTVAILALVLGVLQLAASLLNLPFMVPIFPILLIVLGVILVVRALESVRAA